MTVVLVQGKPLKLTNQTLSICESQLQLLLCYDTNDFNVNFLKLTSIIICFNNNLGSLGKETTDFLYLYYYYYKWRMRSSSVLCV